MRPIDADALKPDYIIPSSSTNTLCTQLVSLQQILTAPTIDEQKIAVEYCQKRNLVMITAESFEVLKAYYNRRNMA